MLVVEGVEEHTQIRQIPGQAYTLEVGVESPFDDAVICQGIQYRLRNLLSIGKVDDLHLTAVHGIAEKQDSEVRRFGVAINAAPGFNVDRN